MRVIAGSLRSRTLQAPAGQSTRPTSDRLRETLFNVLTPRIQGARFLDLFAGSGAVGIEALSRGAELAVFVERAPAALSVLRANLARLGFARGFQVVPGTVAAALRKLESNRDSRGSPHFNLVFLDPPYDAAAEYSATLSHLGGRAAILLAPDAVVIAEHRRKEALNDLYERLERFRLLEQGDAALSFYALRNEIAAP